MASKRSLSDLRTQVLRKLGYPSNKDTVLEGMIDDWLNEGQEILIHEDWWPWTIQVSTITATSGTQDYSLSANARSLKRDSLRASADGSGDSYTRVFLVPREKAEKFIPNSQNQLGTPTHCWLQAFDASGNWVLRFYPVPDNSSMTIEYPFYERVTDITAATGTFAGPPEADWAIRDYAMWKAFEHAYGETDAQALSERANYERALENLRVFIRADEDLQTFEPPPDVYDLADSIFVDLNTSDPLDLRRG